MQRISTGFSIVALMAALSCLSLPHGTEAQAEQVAIRKPDFSVTGIDPMPVGTAKQVKRMRQAKAERKI